MFFMRTLWEFYIFYGFIIGAGLGGSFVPLVSTVARWFVRRRSMMTGVTVAGIGAGALLLPPLANWLIEGYGWRRSYLIMGVIVLLVVIACAWFLRRDPAQRGERPYGATDSPVDVTGISDAQGFTLRQAVVTSQFWMFYFMLFCFGFNAFSFTVHFVPHVTDLGISASNAALIVSITGGVSIMGSLFMGSWADRIGNRLAFAIAFFGLVIYYVGLITAYQFWVLLLLAAISSFTTGGAGASESPLAASLFGLKAHGLIYGVAGTGFTIGAGIGPLLTGYIYDANGDYNLALVLNAVVGAAGACLSLTLKPTRKLPSTETQ
jgi:MFS family permease